MLFQSLFGMNEPELLFDISVHVGTLVAVLAVFRAEILELVGTMFKIPGLVRKTGGFSNAYHQNENVRLCVFIVLGTIPTVVLGLFFRHIADVIFGSTAVVGLMLLVTGITISLPRLLSGKTVPQKMTITHSLIIGIIQGLAIIPGISRSGSTISTALLLGIDRKLAGRFSFLLSIPAIIGALILGLKSPEIHTTMASVHVLLGAAAATISGYLALIILLRLVERGKLHLFAPYCFAVGAITIIVGYLD